MVSVRIVTIIIELHLTKRHVGQMNVLAYRNFYQMEHARIVPSMKDNKVMVNRVPQILVTNCRSLMKMEHVMTVKSTLEHQQIKNLVKLNNVQISKN